MEPYRKIRQVTLDIPKEAWVGMETLLEEGKKYGLVPMAPGYSTRDFMKERIADGIAVFEKKLTRAKAPSIIVP